MSATSTRYLAPAFVTAIVVAAIPTSAHHSDAGIDMESIVAFEGVVTDFVWRNPHVYVLVDRAGEEAASARPLSGSCKWDPST